MPATDPSSGRHPLVRWALVVAALVAVAVLVSMLFSWLVETRQKRTVFVSAATSRLELTLLEEQAPFGLGEVLLCLPRETPRRARDFDAVMSCHEGAWHAVPPGTRLPPAAEVRGADWPADTTWPRAFVFDPPPGTRLEFETVGDFVEIRFLGLPDGVRQAEGIVRDARLIMTRQAFAERGRYLVRAELELGTPPGTSQRGYVTSGEISFRAHAMLTYTLRNPPDILLREVRIPLGGHVRFENLREQSPSPMNVQILAGGDGFDVQAVNVPGPTAAILQYVGTEPLRLVPLWSDLIVKDPFIALLSVIGGLTGLGAYAGLFRKSG